LIALATAKAFMSGETQRWINSKTGPAYGTPAAQFPIASN
jgi:hypothetical protein